MSRIPVAFFTWHRPGAKPQPSPPPVPGVIRRLRAMLAYDEQRRARLGTWPPPITLPRLGGSPPSAASGGSSSCPTMIRAGRRGGGGPFSPGERSRIRRGEQLVSPALQESAP